MPYQLTKSPLPYTLNLSVSQTPAGRSPRISRSVTDALAPLDVLALSSPNLLAKPGHGSCNEEEQAQLPRYVFIGPKGGDEPVRLGLFAGIHGDEPEGVFSLINFIKLLERDPTLATGYCLFIYPICNPTGFEDGTRRSRSGKDLNREFWNRSVEPEVKLLEAELTAHRLNGMISLHTDETSHGFYGYAHGATLTQTLIKPALKAAREFLPINEDAVIDGFPARQGVIRDRFKGSLCAPPGVRPRPFEIILETPQAPPAYLKEAALVASLRAILVNYRELIAYAANL